MSSVLGEVRVTQPDVSTMPNKTPAVTRLCTGRAVIFYCKKPKPKRAMQPDRYNNICSVPDIATWMRTTARWTTSHGQCSASYLPDQIVENLSSFSPVIVTQNRRYWAHWKETTAGIHYPDFCRRAIDSLQRSVPHCRHCLFYYM